MDSFLAAFSGIVGKAEKLAIAKPEDGAKFTLVPGSLKQKIICQAVGNPEGSRLWWFVDGASAGESVGTDPFAADMVAGEHEISCSTAEQICTSDQQHNIRI